MPRSEPIAYLTTGAAAAYLGISPGTLRRAARRGDIRAALRTPGGYLRFSRDAVDAYTERHAARHHAPEGPVGVRARLAFLLSAQERIDRLELDEEAVLAEATRQAMALTGANGSWIAIAHGGRVVCRTGTGSAAALEGMPLSREAVSGSGVVPGAGPGPEGDWELRGLLGARSLLVAPFAIDGGVSGSLGVAAARPAAFGADDALGLRMLAGMLTSALRHAANDLANEMLVTERTAALVALQAIDESLQHLIHTAPVGVCIASEGGEIEVANGACCAVFGFRRGELVGLPLATILPLDPGADRPGSSAGDQIQLDVTIRSGEPRAILASTAEIMGADGDPRRAAFFIDITARHQAERALQRERDFTSAVLETAGCIVAILDHGGRIMRVNRALETTTGFGREELYGRPMDELFQPSEDAAPARSPFEDLAPGSQTHEHESYLITRSGEPRLVAWSTTVLAGDEAEPEYIICTGIDITSRKHAEEQLTRLAHYDALTGLPNRVLFADRLAQALLAMPRLEKPACLLLIDLDHFKEVNDTLGHDAGDKLLGHVGKRLQSAIRRSDTAARLGGDEFAVLLPSTDQAGAELVAGKVLEALAAPVVLDGATVHVGGSIGIAVAPAHGQDAGTLLRHTDVAMYTAKRGGGGYMVYAPETDGHSPIRLTLGGELRRAIAGGELRLHYQPVVTLGDAEFVGVEALVRWQHPEHGLLAPGEFIGLAEQTGLIVPLTRWVLEEAICQCSRWHADGLRCSVAINLSARSLGDDQVVGTVAQMLERYGLSARFLTLELTESVVMAHPEQAIAVLTRLAALGVRIAIDDFGIGQSSLSYLQRLPVHELKIDRSFVAEVTAGEGAPPIVPFIMGLGHSLGLGIVVEGVESEETWDRLSALSCDAVQGYFVSRPLPPEQLELWLRERSIMQEAQPA